MKILMINKFLHLNGGSEKYMVELGECLEKKGHQVQYFGMEHEDRVVGNRVNSYTVNMDFHNTSFFSSIRYAVSTIYSREARLKLRKVLNDFCPDVCHLNNFNYQLTPSIILEIVAWREKTGNKCKIIYTAHDYQLICPNHMLYNPNTQECCERCVRRHFYGCINGKCIHGSRAKSIVGAVEAFFWNKMGTYKYIDNIICCSEFMEKQLDKNPIFSTKTTVLNNFTDNILGSSDGKKDYVLYFGRYSEEKGIKTLIEVCKLLPDIKFVFAGNGPLKEELAGIDNIEDVGFKGKDELRSLISSARFSVCPSEWYEPFGLSIIESQKLGTPVIGTMSGGIPELINNNVNGIVYKAGDVLELKRSIELLWNESKLLKRYSENCLNTQICSVDEYYDQLMQVYIG